MSRFNSILSWVAYAAGTVVLGCGLFFVWFVFDVWRGSSLTLYRLDDELCGPQQRCWFGEDGGAWVHLVRSPEGAPCVEGWLTHYRFAFLELHQENWGDRSCPDDWARDRYLLDADLPVTRNITIAMSDEAASPELVQRVYEVRRRMHLIHVDEEAMWRRVADGKYGRVGCLGGGLLYTSGEHGWIAYMAANVKGHTLPCGAGLQVAHDAHGAVRLEWATE